MFHVLFGGESAFAFVKIIHCNSVFLLKTEKTKESHHQLQKLSSDLSKPISELKIANRLFGEKTHLFLQVNFAIIPKKFFFAIIPMFLSTTH